MQNKHDGILRSINSDRTNINILTAPTHERYQGNMAYLPYNFFMLEMPGVFRPWNYKQGEMPKNHTIGQQIPNHLVFDIILSQNKFGQAQEFKRYADEFNIPWINIEHTWPHPDWTYKRLDQLKALKADVNIFISQQSCEAWGWDPKDPSVKILRHGVDTNIFKPNPSVPKTGKILTVVNDYVNRSWAVGYDIYEKVTEGLPTFPVGDTPGLSESASQQELIIQYQRASVFLNTSKYSPIPTSILEAASCACPIVTTDTCAVPDLIEDGVNGFISNDIDYLKDRLKWCLDNPKEANELGQKARQTIIEKFSLGKHIENWKDIIESTYGTAHSWSP